jgi:AAA domain/AAA domain, putative AbiEii toxin, Type IV TA system
MNIPPAPFPGSRWWRFDFHTHTPASSDYGSGPNQSVLKARACREWINDFILAGIECVAVTDHHCGDWIDPLKVELLKMRQEGRLGADRFFLFPGTELSIGGVHFLAIFDPSATGKVISDLLAVARYNQDPINAQGYCEETDVGTICKEVIRLGGIFIPAHVDLKSTGLFKTSQSAALGPILKCDAIQAMEIVDRSFVLPAIFVDSKVRWVSVLGSDSHHPSADPSRDQPRFHGSHFTWVKMGAPSLDELRLALHDGNDFSLIRSDERAADFDPNETPHDWIESLEITNARLMGLGFPAVYSFNPWMNAIIGGRGSGKSTLIHFIRLATKRGEDLSRLGYEKENRVLKNFNSFARVAGGRIQDAGGLRVDTQAILIYRKGSDRYRLTWLASDRGTTVETWDENLEDWMSASSQDVVERFPLRIFSQDEIGLIAERPEALLARVDEGIAKADWQARWNETENRFLTILATIRSLRSRLAEKDRLTGQLEDLVKQLATFEKSEHAKVRKDYQKVTRQEREMNALLEVFNELSENMGAFNDGFLLHDLPDDLIDPENPADSDLKVVDEALHSAAAKASKILEKVRLAMKALTERQQSRLQSSQWFKSKIEAEAAHVSLIEALRRQGVEDPSAFATLVARRQTVEKALKEIAGIEKEISNLTEVAIACRGVEMLTLRTELRTMRGHFLSKELGGNPYVQIFLNAFGDDDDKDRVEKDLRGILGCEDNRFSDALRDSEKKSGFVEGIYALLPPNEAERANLILERIQTWKQDVVNAGKGKTSNLPARFHSFIATKCKERPEFLDRLLVWWPEDSLVVSYSRGGDGKNFVPLTTGSAGEKAAALLAFFLAHGDAPLILDQPENDLDNHLITDLVVKQMHENKKRRQIIVVTHNPNIVVNGDADMVNAMNFAGGQCRTKASGALQEAAVRTEVCEVMEGGRAALKSRFQRLI